MVPMEVKYFHLAFARLINSILEVRILTLLSTNSIRIKKDDKGVVVKEEDGSDAVEVIVSQEDKCYIVDLMLEQIANFCPLIPRYDIT